jgi:hypothetical protein
MLKTFLLLLTSFPLLAQVHVDKLVIRQGEIYSLAPSDILVSDTLIMMDSSRIRLNGLKRENYIRARIVIVGSNCVIEGRGVHGTPGKNGVEGITPIGPCMNGGNGKGGAPGLHGTSGIDLFLYIDKLKTLGSLVIDLSGGNGGNGGDGGKGGGGSPGTYHCNGGDGGNGGNGGFGGNGGNGGALLLGGEDFQVLRSRIGSGLTLYSKGGTFGYGGVSGHSGAAGLGPNKKHGKGGVPGQDGKDGKPGNHGSVQFED